MASKMDFSKPYGTTHGNDDGRYFIQNGQHFHKDGTLWEPAPQTSDTPPAPPVPVQETPEFKAAVDAAVKAQADAVPIHERPEFLAAVAAAVDARLAAGKSDAPAAVAPAAAAPAAAAKPGNAKG